MKLMIVIDYNKIKLVINCNIYKNENFNKIN